jgi:hypothetical protein
MREISDVVARARSGSLDSPVLADPAITVTNDHGPPLVRSLSALSWARTWKVDGLRRRSVTKH